MPSDSRGGGHVNQSLEYIVISIILEGYTEYKGSKEKVRTFRFQIIDSNSVEKQQQKMVGVLLEGYWVISPIHLFNNYLITSYVLSAVLDTGVAYGLPTGRIELHQESLEPEAYVVCLCLSVCNDFILLHCCPTFPTWERTCLLTGLKFYILQLQVLERHCLLLSLRYVYKSGKDIVGPTGQVPSFGSFT